MLPAALLVQQSVQSALPQCDACFLQRAHLHACQVLSPRQMQFGACSWPCVCACMHAYMRSCRVLSQPH
jgi:hypothetical protein